MKHNARNKKMQRYVEKHILFITLKVAILLTFPNTSLKEHLYEPETCYVIMILKHREDLDVLMMTWLENYTKFQ